MPNRLARSASPYLRAHAANPIDWWEWGPEAFEEAAERDVPVLVSIGYSACHWCHVMATETFSDPGVAEVINDNFVAIKVDREARPDVDQVFMTATQTLTGQGGWPNTVFCTPAGQPFFAGTYFPPVPRDQMPSFLQVATLLAQAWKQRRKEVLDSAASVVASLAEREVPENVPAHHLGVDRLVTMVELQKDREHGGYGTGAKFPQFPLLDGLLAVPDQRINDSALFTLESMARGGIHDQVGGGFHRYAVDRGWEVPHFEKMLVDNALALGTFTRGWTRTVADDGTEQRELFETVIRTIVSWLRDEMLVDGGFAASLDADSTDEEGELAEGAYYLWTPHQFDEYLGRDSRFAQGVFHVTYGGNLPRGAHEPTGNTGRSTLQFHGNPHPGRVANVVAVLKEIRARRPRPARDDTVVSGANGLVIDALTRAALVFGEHSWLDLAEDAAEFVWERMWDRERRVLAHSVLGEQMGPDGLAADYAFVAIGWCRLAGALGQPVWARRAVELMERAWELFFDGETFYDGAAQPELFARPRRLDDESAPSATSAAVLAYRLLARLMDRPEFSERANLLARSLDSIIVYSPRFAGWHLADLVARQKAPSVDVVVIEPDNDPMNEMSRAAARHVGWGSLIVTTIGDDGFGALARDSLHGRSTAYVCRGFTCLEPTVEVDKLVEQLGAEASFPLPE